MRAPLRAEANPRVIRSSAVEGIERDGGTPSHSGRVSRTTTLARVGTLLGTPFVLAIAVLVLVSTVGVIATAGAYARLRTAGRARADIWLEARSDALRASLDRAFGVADPLLDRLARAVRASPASSEAERLVPTLETMATARPGLAWVSVSYPDGVFVGVRRHRDGVLRGLVSRLVSEQDLAVDRDGTVRVVATRATRYDPRARSFYRLAVAERRRVWTPPYRFLPDPDIGVSRVEPVYARGGQDAPLLAVLTVDFDAVALTKLVGAPALAGQHTRVVTSRGVVLASQGARLRDVRKLTRTARVATLGEDHISLVIEVPEHVLYREANLEARRGALATGLVALCAVVLSALISSGIARLRRARVRAEHAAMAAHEKLSELGRYELLALIGSGAMGDVYRARHTLLAREAALKLIRSGEEDDEEEERERFFLEARRLAAMHSLHTVTVYDFGVAKDGRYFLAMELLSGLDLDALVRVHGPQPATRVACMLAEICDSLAEAHEAGLVHQDIKPANVFLCRLAEQLDVIKVLDFGLSRLASARERTLHRLEGTPAYMAPEQIVGEPVGPHADLYAVGGLGFYLLTGRPPFTAKDRLALFDAHVNGPIPALPADIAARTPRALAQLLTRCLAKRPEHRPSSARSLARALREVAHEHEASFDASARERWWAENAADLTPSGSEPEGERVLDVRLDSAHTMRSMNRA